MTEPNRHGRKRHFQSLRFNPRSRKPFPISRTKIELFLRCPRCFYLNQRLNVKLADEAHYNLNLAIDRLIKQASDRLRLVQHISPLALRHGVNAVPFNHPNINDWLFAFKGLRYLHEPTNLIIYGAPDEIWLVSNSELSIVDAKATSSKKGSVEQSNYWKSYTNQVEIYSWLLAKQGLPYPVSPISYFIYANTKPEQNYDNTENLNLDFNLKIVPYGGKTDWVEQTILSLKECLMSKTLPKPNKKCQACKYRAKARKFEE